MMMSFKLQHSSSVGNGQSYDSMASSTRNLPRALFGEDNDWVPKPGTEPKKQTPRGVDFGEDDVGIL